MMGSKCKSCYCRNGTATSGAHVQGVRDMVINTQKTNIHKISSILESNMTKVSLEVDVHNNSHFNASCYYLISLIAGTIL